ncbi:MAG TPA: hypothetical protein VJN21_11335 [Candidatus Acidoferrales bacterium]|nr:hypothetical protein [Candidatus Acidoferrales bacterium]
MHGPLSLIGILVVCAGLHLLWLSRGEIVYWMETWVKIFRASLRNSQNSVERRPQRPRLSRFSSSREHVLRMMLGLSLALVVGPVLIFLGLVL